MPCFISQMFLMSNNFSLLTSSASWSLDLILLLFVLYSIAILLLAFSVLIFIAWVFDFRIITLIVCLADHVGFLKSGCWSVISGNQCIHLNMSLLLPSYFYLLCWQLRWLTSQLILKSCLWTFYFIIFIYCQPQPKY